MVTPKFPHELLQQSATQRVEYFVNYVMSHPLLSQVFTELIKALYQAGGPSLIFLLGPTGVGKTTLLKRLTEIVIERAQAQMELDKGYIPIASITAVSPEFSQFDWHDFYIRGLRSLADPFINDQTRKPTKRELRFIFEDALKNRHLDVFCVDEAQEFCKVPTGKKLRDQTDCLKSIANISKVKILLTSTYEADTLLDLSDQLCRRSLTIHFPCYKVRNQNEKKQFQAIIQSLASHMPLAETPNLAQHYDLICERSCCCFGIMKDWFSRTLGAVLEKDNEAKTITEEDLYKHALPVKKCLVIQKAIARGEEKMEEKEADLIALRKGLGLPERASEASPNTSSSEEQRKSKSNRNDVGKPAPKRYPLGEALDGDKTS